MENDEVSSVSAPVPTEFGKMLRIERINRGMKSGKKMAEALGITASMLSEIENGKKEGYPDIGFLIRCRDFFGWKIQEGDSYQEKVEKGKKTIELFEKGLLCSDIFSIDMNYFQIERKDMFVKAVMALLFIPVDHFPNITVLSPEYNQIVGLHQLLGEKARHGDIYDVPSPPPRKKITRNRKGKPPAE